MHNFGVVCSLFLTIFVLIIATEKPPHIIFFMVDDMGWNDVSYHGMTEIYTPNIDTLANAGVILDNYYALSLCTPSRGALMTGLYPVRTGLQHLVFFDSTPDALPLEYTILPQRLKSKGYLTHMVGKWHLGFYHRNLTPTARGFDSHYGYWTGSTDYFQKTSSEVLPTKDAQNLPPDVPRNGTESFAGLDWRNNMEPMTVRNDEYVTDLFTKKTAEIIRNHDKSKPLFLYLAQLAVHRGDAMVPIRSPAKYTRGFGYIRDKSRRHFAGKLKALDLALGDLMEELNHARMLHDTVIIFTSDNGASNHGPYVTSGSNWPLRGEKNTNYEGGIRVPAFVWSPMLQKTPRISNQMIHMVDWLPTLYSAAGGDVKDLGQLDGLNQWPTITNDVTSPRTGFVVNIDPITNTRAMRQGEWKLLKTDSSVTVNSWYGPTGLVKNPCSYPESSKTLQVLRSFYRNPRLTFPQKLKPLDCGGPPPSDAKINNCGTNPCLFNIDKDPCEFKDLSTQFPEKLAELDKMLNETSTVPPINFPPDFNAAPMFHCGIWDSWLDSNRTKRSLESC